MHHQPIAMDQILCEGAEADRYIFTYRPDLSGLTASIREQGLFHPPLVRAQAGGRFQIISGSRRILAFQALGNTSINAWVLPQGGWTDKACLCRSLWENHWSRGFNTVEKALLFTRLTDQFPDGVNELEPLLQNDLKLPRDPAAISPYRFLLTLPEKILESLSREAISLGQALLLQPFSEGERLKFFTLMTACGLNLQESRQVSDWIMDLSTRESVQPEQFIQTELEPSFLESGLAPRQNAQKLFALLRQKRFPCWESWKKEAEAARNRSGLQDKGLHVSFDPTFETSQLKVQLLAHNETDFKRKMDRISDAYGQGKISDIFQTITKGPGSHK